MKGTLYGDSVFSLPPPQKNVRKRKVCISHGSRKWEYNFLVQFVSATKVSAQTQVPIILWGPVVLLGNLWWHIIFTKERNT